MDVIHKRILEPSIGDIVYQKMPRGNYVKVQITDGYFFDKNTADFQIFGNGKSSKLENIRRVMGIFTRLLMKLKKQLKQLKNIIEH